MAPKMNKEKQLKENIQHRMMFLGPLLLSPIFANNLTILTIVRVHKPSNEIAVSVNEYIM